jgi:hypothetical protein
MGIPFEERNISSDPEARRLFLEKGYDTLPVLEIGDRAITHYTGEPLLIDVLAHEGYLP